MLLGHIGASFAGKSIDSKTPIWIFIVAALIPDLASVIISVIKIESNTVFLSHSLFLTLIYGIIFSSFFYLIFRRLMSSVIILVLVISHWLFDLISWPLEVVGIANKISAFSSDKVYGLGLYKTIPVAIITEITLLGIGVFLFLHSRNRSRKYSK